MEGVKGQLDEQPHVKPVALPCQATHSPKVHYVLYLLHQHVKVMCSVCARKPD